jgi:hypothetical protein
VFVFLGLQSEETRICKGLMTSGSMIDGLVDEGDVVQVSFSPKGCSGAAPIADITGVGSNLIRNRQTLRKP